MSIPDIRWRQRFQSFRKAFAQLEKGANTASQRELNDLEQQGLIQAFEFTHELAWNTLKDLLQSEGAKDLFGSRTVTRAAFSAELIDDGETWMAMIDSRNKTSHTYNEAIADEIATAISTRYLAQFRKLIDRLTPLENDAS